MFNQQIAVNLPASVRSILNCNISLIRDSAISVVMVLLAISAFASAANAADIRELELTDGSVITGEVVSLSDGIYTVRSDTLGTLRIEASNIRSIRLQGSAAPKNSSGQLKSLEGKMLSDSEIMESVRALQDDPDLQKILQDPEIMKAVQSADFATLMNNPEFMKLMDKQPVQDISKKLQQ